MPNKKTQRNGFYFYMQDKMPEYKRAGHHFPRGMADVVPIAHPSWRELPQEEKDRYDQRAKEEKARMRGSEVNEHRMDNTRTIIAHRQDPAEELQKEIRKERQYRQLYLNWRVGPSMLHEKVYLIDFTSMCKLEEYDPPLYIPLELALAEYTMKDGILRTLHKFISPGKIPLGYRYDCQNKSELTHQIPIEGFNLASKEYLNVWLTLENFVSGGETLRDFPVFYTTENKREEVIGCIEWLRQNARITYNADRFRVYHLESMVTDLYRNSGLTDNPPSEATIYDILTTTAFDYQKKVVCHFHEELDCKYCAMGRVRIYCYSVSDTMAALYDYTLTKNHIPEVSGDVGIVIVPKPIHEQRNLRQQINPNFRGGSTGRGYHASSRPDIDGIGMGRGFPPQDSRFASTDIRLDDYNRSYVREPVDIEEFLSASMSRSASLRHPNQPGIASTIPPALSTNQSIAPTTSINSSSNHSSSLIHSGLYKNDPAVRLGGGVSKVPAKHQPIVIGEKVEEAPGPLSAPWTKQKPAEKKSFDEDFPSLSGDPGVRPGGPLGRPGGPLGRPGMTTDRPGGPPAREINLGRGKFTFGITPSTNTALLGAGRGRGLVVRPPPGLGN